MNAQLIVALDVPDTNAMIATVDKIGAAVSFYKVGLELFISAGPQCLAPLHERGKSIFLDLKLHDIPRTVANAVRSAAAHNVSLLTVHAGGGAAMLRAAADAAAEFPQRPRIVAVTALTSLNDTDLQQLGVTRSVAEHARSLGTLAIESGIDGLVCSANEVADLRHEFGPQAVLVTPGIRPAGAETGDQKRVATPAAAVANGASYLVVGRPILEAENPAAAAQAILSEMHNACGEGK